MMIWLDSILALPGVGIGFDATISERMSFRDRLIPVIEKETGLIQITFPPGSVFTMEFKLEDGFQIRITDNRIVADFGYFADHNKEPGKLPQTISPEQKAYSDILDHEIEIVQKVWKALTKGDAKIKTSLLGIFVQTHLDAKALPPGIQSFFHHLKKPWDNGLFSAEGKSVAILERSDERMQRCHHTYTVDFENLEKEVLFGFDFQNIFHPAIELPVSSFPKKLQELRKHAEAYFESFAEGGLKYD